MALQFSCSLFQLTGFRHERRAQPVGERVCSGIGLAPRLVGRRLQRLPRDLRDKMKAPYTLTTALASLMVLQSVLGLVFHDQYRDVE